MKSNEIFEREGAEWTYYWWDEAGFFDRDRVACIGDSITHHYRPEVQKLLNDRKISVDQRAGSHCAGDPAFIAGLEYFFGMHQNYIYDVIHFNNGLHGDCNNTKIPFDIYCQGIKHAIAVIRRLQPQAKIIIATCTHMTYGQPDNSKLDMERNAVVMKRNEFLRQFAAENGYMLDDLFPLVAGKAEYPHVDGIHFGPEGVNLLAHTVANKILEAFGQEPLDK